MSRQQKWVLVGLLLLALLFAALIGWGATRPACPRGDSAPACTAGAGMKGLGKLFSGSAPQAELPQQRYEMAKTGSIQVDIGPAKATVRTLKLKRAQGRFDLSLFNIPVEGGPSIEDQDKATPLPRDAEEPGDRDRQTFAVTKSGGRLTITCVAAPCMIETE